MPQVVVRRRQAPCHSCATEETDYPLGEVAGRSEEAGGIQAGGRPLCLHGVHEDLEHLRGTDDDGDDLHGAATAGADQQVRVVDLLDESRPCGAALSRGDGELGLGLVRRADAEAWLRLMVALPPLGSEAKQVWLSEPCTVGARGVQAVGPNESAPRIGKVLQDFGQKSDGREDLGVGLEEVRIGRAIDDGVRASLEGADYRACAALGPLYGK